MEYAAFKNRSPVAQKLEAFGFLRTPDGFFLKRAILGGEFEVETSISPDGAVHTRTVETATGEEYVLHLVEEAQGTFVGSVREAFFALLGEIADACFEADAFKGETAHRVIAYVRARYGCELEFLWADLPDAAVWRRADNQKWFGALLGAPKKALGAGSEGRMDVVDLRADPAEIDRLADGRRYFRGYHMNKKHWLTMPLDGSVPAEEICARLDESYALAGNCKKS